MRAPLDHTSRGALLSEDAHTPTQGVYVLPDRLVSISISYDAQSADFVAVYTGPNHTSAVKEWSTTSVPAHCDNEWHTIRDLLVDWIGEDF